MKIAEHITRINPWWMTGKVDADLLPGLARGEFSSFYGALHRAPVLALIGPRRMGKTTMMYGVIQRLIAEGIPARRLLYIDAQDPMLAVVRPSLAECFAAYLDDILEEPISALSAPIYVFVDEAHMISSWHTDIKVLTDYGLPIRWIVSSSHKALLYKGARVSLLGRVENFHLPPLDFAAFCRFFSHRNPRVDLGAYLEALPAYSAFLRPAEYARALEDAMPILGAIKPSVMRAMREFAASGGYPEYEGSAASWQKRWIGEMLPSILYHDILAPGGVKSSDVLMRTLAAIARNNGGAFSYTAFAAEMGVDTVTIQGYMSSLQRASLIEIQENYVETSGRVIRKNKKLSILDLGLLFALRRHEPSLGDREAEARMAEGFVLMAAHQFAERELFALRYWHDEPRIVDWVVDMGGSALPVVLSHEEGEAPKEVSLRAFLGKFSAEAGVLVTRDTLSVEDAIVRIPLWLLRG